MFKDPNFRYVPFISETLPDLILEQKTPNNITLSTRAIPQQPRGVTHEIWLINLARNETYTEMEISPIALQYVSRLSSISLKNKKFSQANYKSTL